MIPYTIAKENKQPSTLLKYQCTYLESTYHFNDEITGVKKKDGEYFVCTRWSGSNSLDDQNLGTTTSYQRGESGTA